MGFRITGSRAVCLAVTGLACSAACALVGASDAQAMTVRQVDATPTTVEVAFTAGANEEIVGVDSIEAKTYDTGEWVPIDSSYIESLTTKGATLANIEPGSVIAQVRFNYKLKYGGSSTVTKGQAAVSNIVAIPQQARSLKIAGQLFDTKKLKLSFTNPGAFEGYQVKLTAASGSKDNVNIASSLGHMSVTSKKRVTTEYFDAKFNTVYKARVRTWVTMDDEAKTKKYSAWSEATTIVPEPDMRGARTTSGAAKLSWVKVKGASSYSVFAATRQDGPFKKVATTKSASATIKSIGSKKLAKNKTCYFYVQARAKQGSKTYTSPRVRVYSL